MLGDGFDQPAWKFDCDSSLILIKLALKKTSQFLEWALHQISSVKVF
jgi:hypothetical protein